MKKRALLLAGMLLFTACDEMANQPKNEAYEGSNLFADGKAMQAPPSGTVSRDAPRQDAVLESRPPLTAALLERGQERFRIFCTPCHGETGDGNGIVPARGFPNPPTFHSDRLRQAREEHFLKVIRDGYGAMYSYADRVPPADRWAIVAYIRALQISQHTPVSELPEREQAQVRESLR